MFPYGGHCVVAPQETWICRYNPVSQSAEVFLALVTEKDVLEIGYLGFKLPDYDTLISLLQQWGGVRISLSKWRLSLSEAQLERYTLFHKSFRFVMEPIPDRSVDVMQIPKLLL